MKADIHPKYFESAKVTCACGASFVVGSTLESFKVEICSSCHPFFSGQEKVLDTAGRVERFKKRQAHGLPRVSKKKKGGNSAD